MQSQKRLTVITKQNIFLLFKSCNTLFFLHGLNRAKGVCFAISFVVVLTSVFSFPKAYALDSSKTMQAEAASAIEFKRAYLKHIINQQERLVLSLAETPLMTAFLSHNDPLNRDNLNQFFLAVSDVNEYYMQVRFIDAQGQEQIRIDHPINGVAPVVIKGKALQDKSDRGYFKAVKKMPNGSLWHSAFDLNQEHGAIEQLINPTYRVASPVYLKGHFSGMVIINLAMIRVVKYMADSTHFRIYLVDANNDFLIHPDPKLSWSKYLPKRGKYQETPERKANTYTQSLEDIFKNGEGIRIILEPNSSK